jgi:excisionase family DNA binding protein
MNHAFTRPGLLRNAARSSTRGGLAGESALAAWAAMATGRARTKETRTMPIRKLTGVNDPPMLATVDETAALLRTTRKAIYSMIERGQLPGVTRIGRRVLIRTPDLLDWLRQKSTPSLER